MLGVQRGVRLRGKGVRRAFAVASVLTIALVSATPVLAAQTQPRRPAATLSSLEHGVLSDINALRAQHHLVPLRLSSPLTSAARAPM